MLLTKQYTGLYSLLTNEKVRGWENMKHVPFITRSDVWLSQNFSVT